MKALEEEIDDLVTALGEISHCNAAPDSGKKKYPLVPPSDGKSPVTASPRHYERGIPGVVQASPRVDDSSDRILFHAVAIRYELVMGGKDPLQQHATEFGILLPTRVDPAVAAMVVELFLQENSIVRAHLEEIGEVLVSSDEVVKIKEFTKWLFDLVLGRSQDARLSEYREGPKLYYAVPLLETWRWRREEFKLVVDWNLMAAATSSGLHYADSMIASEAQASNEKIAIDSLILCAGKSCVVLSKHLNEVVAVRAHRALSYLTKHNGATLTKKLRAVTFSRRECVLSKTLLPGSLHRGALRLPSVMYRLEMALLAAELRDAMDVPVSALKLLEALTSRACCFNVSYEPLELLGDSVLKIVAGTYVYATMPSMGSEELGLEMYNIVCNSTLSSLALARNLYRYVFAEMFSPLKWISPGMIPAAAEIPEQLLSTKTLADVVEAVLGACVLEGELAAAMAAANWLQIPVRFPPGAEDHHRFEVTGCGSLTDDDLKELQEKLGYQFRNKQVLRVALSFHDDNFTFRRLEFLGDAVLDYLVTRHLVRSFPDQSAGRLNTIKQATINKEHYSCVSIRHGFHVYLQKVHFVPQIAEFAESLVEEHARGKACSTFGISRLNSPKLLGDMIQTLAASIFIDSEYEPDIVWKVYERLLEPIATPENVMLHPVKQLETLCREQRLALEIQCTEVDGFIRADVVIDNERVSCCEHEEKRVARRLAAMQAVQKLTTSNRAVSLTSSLSRSTTS